jgi:hypothetical protein
MATTTYPLPPTLAEIAFNTKHILTKQFARITCREPQTIRKILSQKGEVFGITPEKIGNRLLWPVSEVAALFTGAKG